MLPFRNRQHRNHPVPLSGSMEAPSWVQAMPGRTAFPSRSFQPLCNTVNLCNFLIMYLFPLSLHTAQRCFFKHLGYCTFFFFFNFSFLLVVFFFGCWVLFVGSVVLVGVVGLFCCHLCVGITEEPSRAGVGALQAAEL